MWDAVTNFQQSIKTQIPTVKFKDISWNIQNTDLKKKTAKQHLKSTTKYFERTQ